MTATDNSPKRNKIKKTIAEQTIAAGTAIRKLSAGSTTMPRQAPAIPAAGQSLRRMTRAMSKKEVTAGPTARPDWNAIREPRACRRNHARQANSEQPERHWG